MRSDAQEQAFAEFVAARQTSLRRIAYALCGDWQQADDLLHTALTKLYVAWPRVLRAGTEEAYVRRLILRADVDRLPASSRTGVEDDESASPTALLQALLSLSAVERKVVVLRHWLGVPVDEAAEELGISTASVRSHAAHATAALQSVLARDAR